MLKLTFGISNILKKIAFPNTFKARATGQQLTQISAFHTTRGLNCVSSKSAHEHNDTETVANKKSVNNEEKYLSEAELKRIKNDRTNLIPLETSIRYMKSAAYKKAYGEQYVWEQYRRNHKGALPPRKTRKTCIRKGTISTGNPCPICRDKYLILHHCNIDLLQQFISPQTGEVLSYSKTGLCQRKHLELLVAVERAIDYGLLTFDVPFREFDYSEYYNTNKENKNINLKTSDSQ